MERRLAAILVADLVDFSRLMHEDEAGILARLEALDTGIITPLVERRGGRIVKRMGDGYLIEFASVVDAVNCALDWQDRIRPRADEPDALQFRIGINLGDIVVRDNDIFGDGINVAARLESIAEPGSVLVSRTVVDHASGKLEAAFGDLGDKTLKNIPEPVRVYRATRRTEPTVVRPSRGRYGKASAVIAALFGLLAISAGAAYWLQSRPVKVEPASIEAMALPLPDKASVAVLPFDNLSGESEQEPLADGITEDLITDLSKVSGLFVIARNSTFIYKRKSVSIKDVAETLGVQYVLEGSVRRSGTTLRVNAQLIDATTGNHVWADRFDGDASDVFAAQDAFVLKIINALKVELTDDELEEVNRADTKVVAAREAFQRGWELMSNFNERDNARAVDHFQRAIEIDPDYGRAHAALALAFQRDGVFRWNQKIRGNSRAHLYTVLIPDHLEKAGDRGGSMVHIIRAMRQLNFRDQNTGETGAARSAKAIEEAARAVALGPNDPEAHVTMAWALIASGNPEQGLEEIATAKRLDPSVPANVSIVEATAYYALGQLHRAAEILDEAIARSKKSLNLIITAASIHAQLGDRRKADDLMYAWARDKDRLALAENYLLPMQWDGDHEELNRKMADGLKLAALRPTTTVTSLLEDLKTQEGLAQIETLRMLGWFGPQAASAVSDLLGVLETGGKRARREVVITLGKIGAPASAALPALEAVTEEPIIGLRAKTAIMRISGE